MRYQTMDKQWYEIKEFPNYEITKDGNIRNKNTKKIRKISRGKMGYPVISLIKDGKMYLRTIHVIMARQFIPNPDNLPQVNHKDGNKGNYALSNLEWVTERENMIHARMTGLHKSDGDKRILQYDKNMTFIREYKSASEASRITKISRSNICSVARGNTRQKSAGGYFWRYA